MADVNDFKVHDVSIKDAVDFKPASFGKPLTQVTFFVGDHGPFRLEYPKDQATSERINSDIDHQVVELRRVLERS
jgi:hypothetical protein